MNETDWHAAHVLAELARNNEPLAPDIAQALNEDFGELYEGKPDEHQRLKDAVVEAAKRQLMADAATMGGAIRATDNAARALLQFEQARKRQQEHKS